MLWRAVLLWLLLAQSAWAATMLELDYRDRDPGAPAYLTRMLVTKDYLRLDNGKDDDDYLILDRATGRISSVVRDDRRITVIDAAPVKLAKPADWHVKETVEPLPRRGEHARQVSLYVNGTLCSRTVAIQGALPDAVAAMGEYLTTLAATQARTYRETPSDTRDPCDLAQYVLEAGRELKYGLPLEQVSSNGRSRHLLGYRKVELKPGLFRLPADFRRVGLDELRAQLGTGKAAARKIE